MARPVNCPKCAGRMQRIGFDTKEHGVTEFHYTCEQCGHARIRTLDRARRRRPVSTLPDIPATAPPPPPLFEQAREAMMLPADAIPS